MTRPRLDYRTNVSKMVDFDFDDGPVSGSAIVARRAVLWPVARGLGTTHADAKLAARLVVIHWRDRVRRLAEAGLASMASFKTRMLHGNCFPSMVCSPTRPLTLVCRYGGCPWCHGRRVERLACRAGFDDAAAFESVFGGRVPFVACGKTFVLEACGEDQLTESLSKQAAVCRSLVRGNRGWLPAAFWQVAAEPGLSPGGDRQWVVEARMFGVRLRRRPVLPEPKNWGFWDLQDRTPEKVSEALAGVAGYPVGVLTGDVDLSRAALAARAGLRLVESSGHFRGGADDEAAAAVDAPG